MCSSIFEEWDKTISFAEYFFFTPDEGFYCLVACGGEQIVSTNALLCKFLVLGLVTQRQQKLRGWDDLFTT